MGTWTTVPLPTTDNAAGAQAVVGPIVATPTELLVVEDSCAGCVVAGLDPTGDTWDVADVSGSLLVENGLATSGGDYVFIHGGVDATQSGPIMTVATSAILDRSVGAWTPLGTSELQTHTYRTVHWTGEEFLLALGVENQSEGPELTDESEFTTYYDGLFFNPGTSQWRLMPPARDPAEHVQGINPPGGQVAAIWTSHGLFVWGMTPDESDTWGKLFDAEDEVWRDIELEGDPGRLRGHHLLTVGSAVFVHAGHAPGGDLSDTQRHVWRYSLAEDSWSEIEVPEFADPDQGAVVGQRLAFIGRCAAGSLYDPETDSWQVLSEDGAPPPADGIPYGVGDFLAVTGAYYGGSEDEIPAVFLLDLTL